MTDFTMVNMHTGRRDRYVGVDLEEELTAQAARWLPRANWFPIGRHEFYIKVEHLGPTWAHFLLMWMRDRVATRCFVCLDPEVSGLTWDMARKEQAWFEGPKAIRVPTTPWLAVVFPADLHLPIQLYPQCVAIERAMMSAILHLTSKGGAHGAASQARSNSEHGAVLPAAGAAPARPRG